MKTTRGLSVESFHSCSSTEAGKLCSVSNFYSTEKTDFDVSDDDLDFNSEENNQLHLEKLQIGSPIKIMSNVCTPPPPLSTNPQPFLWKDYPFVNHCGSTALSQNSYSYAGSNGSPMPKTIPVLSFNQCPNFNNYRSSAVADIFGGRSKSKSTLLCPSKLMPGPIFPTFATSTNMTCGIYYQSTSSDLWNVLENPISRSSSQSSGFISQKELEPSAQNSRTSTPIRNNFTNSIYPESTSVYSQRQYSIASHQPKQLGQHMQQISIGPNQDYRSYQPRSFLSTPIRNQINGWNTTVPTATCSRFGPRPSLFQKSTGNNENDNIFSDTEDESCCESYKTALEASSLHSLRLRKCKTISNIEENFNFIENNIMVPVHDDCSAKGKIIFSSFLRILYQLIGNIFLFLSIIVMFWLIFGSGASKLFEIQIFSEFNNFYKKPFECLTFTWFNHMSYNLTHLVRDKFRNHLIKWLL